MCDERTKINRKVKYRNRRKKKTKKQKNERYICVTLIQKKPKKQKTR